MKTKKYTDIKQAKPAPAYWYLLYIIYRDNLDCEEVNRYCKRMGVAPDEFRYNVDFVVANYHDAPYELDDYSLTDLLPNDEWSAKYKSDTIKPQCYGWYMEDQVVRIDENGIVFEKSATDDYKEYQRGNTIKDHRWFHSIISRPEVNEITKEQYDNYGVTWRYAGLPGDPSGSEIVYLTAANK